MISNACRQVGSSGVRPEDLLVSRSRPRVQIAVAGLAAADKGASRGRSVLGIGVARLGFVSTTRRDDPTGDHRLTVDVLRDSRR